MELERLTPAEASRWREALRAIDAGTDPYFEPGYMASAEIIGDGVAECLLLRDGASALLLPSLLCPIPGEERSTPLAHPYASRPRLGIYA